MSVWCAILAGGKGLRMGGRDKGEVLLGSIRLIDRVVARLSAQTDKLLLCAPHDYGLGLPFVADRAGIKGPAAGVLGIADYLHAHAPGTPGFCTVPVDSPFPPQDIISRLSDSGSTSIAKGPDRAHPTFAYWALAPLLDAGTALPPGSSPSLFALAEKCRADYVQWTDETPFLNLNTPGDIQQAEAFKEID